MVPPLARTPFSVGSAAAPTRRAKRRALLAALAPALLLVSGCVGTESTSTVTGPATPPIEASASASASASMASAFPVTVTGDTGPLTLAQAPEKIVSLSPSLTETLFAIGAGTQVEAVDDQSNYPAEAPKSDLSGFQPNAEAVAKYAPDLVVLSTDSNGLVAALAKLKVPTLVLGAPKTLEDTYAQMLVLGQATGHEDDAAKVVATTKDRIAKAIASAPASAKGKKIYHELDNTYYSLTTDTFIGSIYKQFALVNIADASPAAAAAGGYPQLSAEYVVKAAPDFIYLADVQCCQVTAASLAKRAGFAKVPAVMHQGVIEGDGDISSRWGPRVADFAESIAATLTAHQ